MSSDTSALLSPSKNSSASSAYAPGAGAEALTAAAATPAPRVGHRASALAASARVRRLVASASAYSTAYISACVPPRIARVGRLSVAPLDERSSPP